MYRSYRSIRWLLGLGLGACLCLATALAQEPAPSAPEIPPAEPIYMGREIAQTMHYDGAPWLVRESREREEDCATLLRILDLKPDLTVCDLGCGNGYYSIKIASQVGPRGSVLAVDIQPEMLRLLQARAAEAQVDNVTTILGTFTDPKLPANTVDLCLLVDVYHELSHPVPILAEVHKSLKPTGRLALVEFRLEDPDVPIKLLHKMSKEQILKELPANRFKLVGEFDGLPWQHVMFFARDDSPLPGIDSKPWSPKPAAPQETPEPARNDSEQVGKD